MNVNEQNLKQRLHLSPAELGQLLADEGAEGASNAAASHLESCTECQVRLSTLAADASWWSEAQTLLSDDGDGGGEPRWEPDASHVTISSADAERDSTAARDMVLKLLGTPNHPEMLGRLGRYDIERIIGSGGMGIVLKAHDSELNRPIAIKLLAPHLSHVGAARERFAREGRAAAAVVHEHVVAIHNVESDGQAPFLVMQYVPGRSLQARVDDDGPLGAEEMLRIGMQAAAGLAAAHRQGLVHRDVKPSNILLENQVERAILTDFGLARAIDDASLTQTGILAGTPHYMSPEQATGGPIDHRSDLFSLGAVLYFMATGHPPFRATGSLAVLHRICNEPHRPAWHSNKAIPDDLCDVIDRLLEKKPGKRFSSAEDVQRELASLLSRSQRHGLGRRSFRGWRGKRLRRKLAWAATIAGAAAVIAAAVGWWESRPVPATHVQVLFTAADKALAKEYEADFFKDLNEVQGALSVPTGRSFFGRTNGDAWGREVKSLQREINELETPGGSFTD